MHSNLSRDMRSANYYRPELDWLRFIAFLAVFALHVYQKTEEQYGELGIPALVASAVMPLVRAGGYGVDLFFALSSFLITKLLLLERERTGSIHIRHFYIRRILRIWPLYFAFIMAIMPFETFLSGTPVSYYLALLTFTGNWYSVFYEHVSSICAPLWSVCVEEQFYLAWPILVSRTRPARFGLIMIALFMFTCTYRTIFVYDSSPLDFTMWFNTFTRLDPFALGGLLAILLHNRSVNLSRLYRGCILGAGFGAFWILGNFPFAANTGTSSAWSYPIAAIASTLFIFAFVTATPRQTYSLPFRALSYLGKISYGLYVYHWGAIYLSHYILMDWSTPSLLLLSCRTVLAAAITVAAAMVSYSWIEKPFLTLKHRFTYIESRPD